MYQLTEVKICVSLKMVAEMDTFQKKKEEHENIIKQYVNKH